MTTKRHPAPRRDGARNRFETQIDPHPNGGWLAIVSLAGRELFAVWQERREHAEREAAVWRGVWERHDFSRNQT